MTTIEIRKTDEYNHWCKKLEDINARARVLTCIRKLSLGNNGDVKPVGEGVSEARIDYAPGCRIYFVQRGKRLIILLGGGDKSTQKADIANTKKLEKELKE